LEANVCIYRLGLAYAHTDQRLIKTFLPETLVTYICSWKFAGILNLVTIVLKDLATAAG